MKTISIQNLKNTLLIVCFCVLCSNFTISQTVQGEIYYDSPAFKVLRVWGTHQERGFAYGYLAGAQISQMINNYLKPSFGVYYNTARNMVSNAANFQFDPKHLVEINAIVAGMNASGNNASNLDTVDLLVGNCMLDIQGVLMLQSGLGCSSLMSWGDATSSTPLAGHAVVTRHLDWTSNTTLLNNHLLVIHQPSEADEQNWIMAGFAGMVGALSGVNNQLALFQHVMSDYNGSGSAGKAYKPIWMAMRQALEEIDYNADGYNDASDAMASFNDSPNGFAAGFLISALADNALHDSLSAMVSELTPTLPTHTYRTSLFPDSIPGDNLYSANYQIGRNNMLHFCSRYNAVKTQLGDGTAMGIEESWALMRDWSHQSNNIQVMQYAPFLNHFRFGVKKTIPAYQSDYVDFDLQEMLNEVTRVVPLTYHGAYTVFPNPGKEQIFLRLPEKMLETPLVEIYGQQQKIMSNQSHVPDSGNLMSMDVSHFPAGVYIIKVTTSREVNCVKFIKY